MSHTLQKTIAIYFPLQIARDHMWYTHNFSKKSRDLYGVYGVYPMGTSLGLKCVESVIYIYIYIHVLQNLWI